MSDQLIKTTNLFGEEYFYPIQSLMWKQPFATLMLYGKIETRKWNTEYRGPVLICASGSPYINQEVIDMVTPDQYKKIQHIISCDATGRLDGHAIAVGILYKTALMTPGDEDKCYVKYNPDLFCHFYKNVKRIQPIQFKGLQKWKPINDQNFLSKIKYL